MSLEKPVAQVVQFLKQASFSLLTSPLVIGQSKFEFSAALMGPGKASDIVLVVDTVGRKNDEIVRRVHGFARALDLSRSRNPLTVILVGPLPAAAHINKLKQVCRVLPVGSISSTAAEAEAHLSNWLAVLTPLEQIDVNGVVVDPIAELEKRTKSMPTDIRSLVEKHSLGASAVEEAVNDLLSISLMKAWEDEQ